MWRKTIAALRWHGGAEPRVLAARVVTGRWAFLAAGLLDFAAVILWVGRRRASGRSYDKR